MVNNILIWTFLGIQLFAHFKLREYNFSAQFADTFTRNFIGWTMLFWFSAGVGMGYWIFKFVNWIFGG